MVSSPNSDLTKPMCWAELAQDYTDILNMVRSANLTFVSDL
jgi:hypothetical protein